MTKDPVKNALTSLEWAERQLSALVTEDNGSGTFVRSTGTELAGFSVGRDALRTAIQNVRDYSGSQHEQILSCIREMVEDKSCRIVVIRPPKDLTKAEDQWHTYEQGTTTFLVIAIGEKKDIEDNIIRMLDPRIRP